MIKSNELKTVLRFVFTLLTPLNKIIKKSDRKIVFYSNLGFRDNVKALFDYLIENGFNKDYKIICCINDVENHKSNRLDNVIYTNNLIGLYHFLTSKYFFYCFGKYPIKPTKEQMVVNLWHGTPLKKIGNLESGKEHIDYNYFTYILASSEFYRKIMMQAFNCTSDSVLICGQPRNDALFRPHKIPYIVKNKRVILWLPTFRSSRSTGLHDLKDTPVIPIFDDEQSLNLLNRYLSGADIVLVIKLHPIQDTSSIYFGKYSNIVLLTERDMDLSQSNLYAMLGSADALITDYSSVYFDYLLLDRPIGFTINDIESYRDSRGFVFEDPTKYMPGHIITSKEAFLAFLEDVVHNVDPYKEFRERINDLINAFKDNHNCKRILELVGITKGEHHPCQE